MPRVGSTNTIAMPVFDVLLVPNGPVRHRHRLAIDQPPLTRQVDLGHGVMLASIRPDIGRAILLACKFRELEWPDEGTMYAFVREDPPAGRWDQDQVITKALFLSHLVHSHLAGFEFTARVETDAKGRLVALKPAEVDPPFARAYCATGVERPWLTQREAGEIANLVHCYDAILPQLAEGVVGAALSAYSEVPFVYHGRPRAALLATTLEGLASRSTERAMKQFTVRIPLLSEAVGLGHLDKAWAEDAYKWRSKLAHGGVLFRGTGHEERAGRVAEFDRVMTDMDELLRRVLKRAVIEADFRERIERLDREAPVPGNGCPSCRADTPELVVPRCPRCGACWT